jgi:hypothetical protein
VSAATVTINPEELRRLVRRDLVVAGAGSLIAIWISSVLLAARLGFVNHQRADKVVAAVSIVICLASVFWWAAGPHDMRRDRYFVLIPLFLAAGPGLYALHDLGAGLVVVALSSAVGFFGAALLGVAIASRRKA